MTTHQDKAFAYLMMIDDFLRKIHIAANIEQSETNNKTA